MATNAAEIPRVTLPFDNSGDEGNDSARRRAINEQVVLDQNKDGAPLEEVSADEVGAKRKSKGSRRILFGIVVLLLLISIGAYALWRMFSSPAQSGQTHKVKTDPNQKGVNYSTDEEKYNAALNALATGKTDASSSSAQSGNKSGTTDVSTNSTTQLADPLKDPLRAGPGMSNNQSSVTISDPTRAAGDRSGQITERSSLTTEDNATSASSVSVSSNQQLRSSSLGSGSTAARSLAFTAQSRLANPPQNTENARTTRTNENTRELKREVAVPPFGAMLPVRSLGMIYTLRSAGGLVRFELTREMDGHGWSMHKGTVVVGALRGADGDRAFISVVGYIDTETGGFVKIQGDMLGSDGASGLKGKRRKVSSGFSQVLKGVGNAGLSTLGALAGAFGRGTIVITDAYSRGTAPLTSELGGLINNNRNEFIEIKAGTPCYVMITQLPDEIHGVEALSRMTPNSLNALSDSAQVRSATGLTEMQLAELISSGDPREIQSAMPQMTPEMRRVAEAVIEQGSGK